MNALWHLEMKEGSNVIAALAPYFVSGVELEIGDLIQKPKLKWKIVSLPWL